MRLLTRATTFLTFLSLGLLAGLLSPTSVHATLTYDSYDVEIDVNQDSTFTVTETLATRFTGEYRGVLRGITLDDAIRNTRCRNNDLRCGGAEYIAIEAVLDAQGNEVDPDLYQVGVVRDEQSGNRYLEVKWEVWPGGRMHDEELFTWSVRYKVFGGLDFDGEYGYFYWNVTPDNPGGAIDSATVQLNLPSLAVGQDLELYTPQQSEFEVANFGNSVTIEGEDLGYFTGPLTVEYRIPKDKIDEHATLFLKKYFPLNPVSLSFQGYTFDGIQDEFRGLPTGEYSIQISSPGYETKQVEVIATDGAEIYIDVSLYPNILRWGLLLITLCLMAVGLFMIPFGAWYVYNHWRKAGRDKGLPATIVPIFKPAEGLKPYIMGSLKDEAVDPEDITGTIIDLAYRGYLKIKELKAKSKYELIRTDKEWDELDEVELDLMDYLFKEGQSITTSDLKNSFYTKYRLLQKQINRQMLADNVYESLPSVTKAKYAGYGVVYAVIGIVITIILVDQMISWVGFPGPFTLSLAMLTTGIAYLIASPFMPAKTAKGSQMLAQTLGFKMYMERAERYRVQNLAPEDFERYLSYAVVFGIERTWADQFKDIYDGQPDWYEGNVGALDVYAISRLTSNFATGMRSQVYTTVPSSSASGSGWSGGGGGFGGGFSGGGGGGGYSGGF